MSQHKGKLFLDFTAPDPPAGQTHWYEPELKKMQEAVEAEINVRDPWRDGNNERNKWLKLYDVPEIHSSMRPYCNKKLDELKIGALAEEDPPQPIAYCYSGDTRICYHPHSVELNGERWHVHVQGVNDPIYIVIVLTYETTVWPY